MRKYFFGLLIFLLTSCGDRTSDYGTKLTVDPSELKYKKGDCLTFKIDSSTYGAGIVFDFSKDEGGLWYGILLTDYESINKPTIDSVRNKRFFGRKVHSTLNERGYEITLDAEYVLDSLLPNNFISVGNISLNDKIEIGSHGATSEMQEFIRTLKNGKERRLTPPDDYHDYLTKLDKFRPDEYFDMKYFLSE